MDPPVGMKDKELWDMMANDIELIELMMGGNTETTLAIVKELKRRFEARPSIQPVTARGNAMADEVEKHDMTDQELVTLIVTNPEMPDLLRRGNTDASRQAVAEVERRATEAAAEAEKKAAEADEAKAAAEGADVPKHEDDDDDDTPHGRARAVHRTGAKR